jgi:hypothetical protein
MPARIMDESERIVYSWDRQEGETKRAYEAFQVYLGVDGNPPIRALTSVAEVFKCSRQNIQRWHHQYKWDIRSSDYDAWKRQKEDEAHEFAARLAVRRVAEKWADHRVAFLERYMSAHLAMLGKVEDMLQYPVVAVEDDIERDARGRVIHITRVTPARWRARDMALITKNLILSLREVMAMLDGPATAAAQGDEDDMAPDEAAAAIRAILEQRARKAGIPGPARSS